MKFVVDLLMLVIVAGGSAAVYTAFWFGKLPVWG